MNASKAAALIHILSPLHERNPRFVASVVRRIEIGSEAWIKAQIAAGKGTDERDAPRKVGA